ncbi:MAG TPA: hypothetical protein VF599_18505 [Pyrinomonadaceae bacterium]|jgi:hypothetical protein
MKKIVVEITGKSGKSFDLTLNDTAWFGIEGDWNCLPGYMPATKGYFDYDSSYGMLYLFNRERSLSETVGYALSSPDSPTPTKMHGSFEGFKDSPAAGQTGKGHIFDCGATAKPILKDHFGSVNSDITWKIKSVI